LDITAVQEAKWVISSNIKAYGLTILYSGGKEHERRIGFVIKNIYLPNVVKFESICFIGFKCRWFNIVNIINIIKSQ